MQSKKRRVLSYVESVIIFFALMMIGLTLFGVKLTTKNLVVAAAVSVLSLMTSGPGPVSLWLYKPSQKDIDLYEESLKKA